jgi:hypothetical protein
MKAIYLPYYKDCVWNEKWMKEGMKEEMWKEGMHVCVCVCFSDPHSIHT